MTTVSVVVPCYNEENTIQKLLSAIYTQTFPHQDVEVVIADGRSTDQTRKKIDEFSLKHPDMKIIVVDNPRRVIPSGLNRAIEIATGEFIVRLDAHSIPSSDYLQRCISALRSGMGENVGGIWKIVASRNSTIAQAIAIAAAHPLGVGDAIYRVGGVAQEVDTVPFGAFRRDYLLAIGMYDERLHTNEDYELNVRIHQSGGRIWFDPNIQSIYLSRSNLLALAQQYWRYGFWKAQMIKRYPRTIRWRQALPPAFVAVLMGLVSASPFVPVCWWAFLILSGIYLLTIFAVGLQTSIKYSKLAFVYSMPAAIIAMHVPWGTGFLWSLLQSRLS
jgi:glycosyltransferase involved in cell wall biosynthesis